MPRILWTGLKWLRLFEQLSPIYKWTPGELRKVQSCPRRREALATNTPKKSFQKLCASARSEVSPSHLREKASARLLISFQESGMSGLRFLRRVVQPLGRGFDRSEVH